MAKKKDKTIYTSYYICPEYGTLFTDFTTDPSRNNDRAMASDVGNGVWQITRPGYILPYGNMLLDGALRYIYDYQPERLRKL